MSQFELTVNKRERLTNGQLNQKRKNGNIPAIFYGKGKNQSFFFKSEDFRTILTSATKNTIYTLKVKDETDDIKQVMVKEMQYHPISYKLLHVDFIEVVKGKLLRIKVPIKFIGEAICKKKDGILNRLIDEVEVECLPKDIPQELTLDITDLEVGHAVHIRDLYVCENVKILSDPDSTVITFTPKDVEVLPSEQPQEEASAPEAADEKNKEKES